MSSLQSTASDPTVAVEVGHQGVPDQRLRRPGAAATIAVLEAERIAGPGALRGRAPQDLQPGQVPQVEEVLGPVAVEVALEERASGRSGC